MAYTPINNLPPAPQRNDSPEDFVTKADAHAASLVAFVTEINAAGAYIDGVGTQVDADKVAAAASAGAASLSETNAGTSALEAENWANQLSATVDGVDYSAKEYAIGNTVPTGSSKEWATLTGSTVDGAEYSAKEYAVGDTVPTGSSKEWATLTGSTVDGVEYSAKHYAEIAQGAVATIPAGSINDTIITTTDTWSSQKISDEINAGKFINKPSVISYANRTLTFSDYQPLPTFYGIHEKTHIQISEVSDFSTSVVDVESVAATSYAYNSPLVLTLYARVRYGSDGHLSEWSEPFQFTTVGIDDNSDVDGLTSAAMGTAGNFDSTTATGFFGEIPATDLVDDYDYRGTWSASIAYTAGQSVVYNAVKYVALTSTTGNQPDISPTQWGVDTRENLPTGRWLFEHMGFGQGVLQFAGNTASDAGWLKFYSHGKVLYVAKKPFAHSISWDAIACRDGVFGDRTVRIGTKLYKVRLLTGAASDPIDLTNIAATDSCTQNYGGGSEYNELIYRIHQTVVTCGSDTYDGGPQVGANWASYTDTDLQVGGTLTGRAKWTQETTSNNTSFRVFRGYDRLSNLGSHTSSNGFTDYGWLPVLELISDGDEPYNSAVLGVGPTQLTYDFHTDTGYFGTVSSAEFISGSALASSIGLTSGTAINDTTDWLKFYWHGQIHYVPMKPLRHSVSWDHIYDRGAVYGVSSMGLFGKGTAAPSVVQNREVTIGTDTFRVKLLKGAENGDVDGSTSFPAADESGRNSEYNDLIYRVHQDVPSSASGLTYDGGGQIGDNWASYTDTDLVIAAGDGRYKWAIERRSDSTSGRVYRGYVRLSGLHSLTSSGVSTDFGWLPSLVLKP
jgi:hypothetical protein